MAMVRLGGHLVSVLTRLPSPDTVRHPIVDWTGGETSQDDNGGLDPLHRGLALLHWYQNNYPEMMIKETF